MSTPKKQTSLVYKYFTKEQDGHKCNSCGVIQKTKCTSNLIGHLQSTDHHEIYISYMQDSEKKKEEANKRNFITSSSSKKRNATDQPTLFSRGITYSTPYKITDNLHKTRYFFFPIKKECFYLYIVFFY